MKHLANGDSIPSKDEDRPDIFHCEIPVNDPVAMEQFQEMMDKVHDDTVDYIGRVALELNVSSECASNIVYLRSRSRWTEKLEAKLIELHKTGNPPNIYEFGT